MKESKPTGKTVSGNNSSFVINKFKFSSSEINKKLTILNVINILSKHGL